MRHMKQVTSHSDNRRRAPRRQLGDYGLIASSDGTVVASCWIVDVSETGARISLFSSLGLPSEFWLSAQRLPDPWRGTIAWQIGNQAGVQFMPGFACEREGSGDEPVERPSAATIVSRILKRPLLVA